MNYTISQINKDFKIVIEARENGVRVMRHLVGVAGLIDFVGAELSNKFVARAYASINSDVCVCRLRSGKVVSFYNI